MYAIVESGGKQYRVHPGQTIEVEIVHDLFSVNDYHYSIIIGTSDLEAPDPLNPAFDWESVELYVLDPTDFTAVSLADLARLASVEAGHDRARIWP